MSSTGKHGHGLGFSCNPPIRPAYNKGNKHLVVDASKFETEPLPRETRGFQPRQSQSTANVPNGNTTSATPSGTGLHDTQAPIPAIIKAEPLPRETRGFQPPQSQPNADVQHGNATSTTASGTRMNDAQAAMPAAIKAEPLPRETRGFQPRQFQSDADVQHGNATLGAASGTRSHDNQAELPAAIDELASKTLVTNTVNRPDRAPGLSDSQWAPKPNLSSMAGLRPHPAPAPTWDDSNGFAPSKRLGLDLNELPPHAWNGGVDPMRAIKNGSSVGYANSQPVNPVVHRAKEVARVTVKPPEPGLITDASKPDNNISQNSNGESAIPHHHLPPHLRPAKPKKAALTSTTSAVDCAEDQSSTVKVSSLKPVAPPSPKGKAKASPVNGAAVETDSNVKTARNEAQTSRPLSKKNDRKPQDEGWVQPVAPAHPLLNVWDGSPANPPEDWEYRTQLPIPKKERKASFQSWLDGQSSEVAANKSIVDITSQEFILGTGVVHENSIVSGPSDQDHDTRRLPNDPLTLARVEQTAQAKVEEHRAKFKEEDVKEELTKEERRALRAAMRQRDIELANAPNPYKPVADIYIRPAERKDIPQITEIYNHYLKTSAIVMELDPLTDAKWTERMEDCRGDGFDMFVAVQKTATGSGRSRRAHAREEPVFGFTYAEATYGKRNSGRFTATVQVYVNWRHLHIGVGRCLMDRVMTMLNFNHDCKPGVEYVGAKPLMQREVKKVVIEVPYWKDHVEELDIWIKVRNEQTGQIETMPGWKTRFLQSLKFEHVATLEGFGLKQASLDNSRSVTIAMFVLDTMSSLSGYRDYH